MASALDAALDDIAQGEQPAPGERPLSELQQLSDDELRALAASSKVIREDHDAGDLRATVSKYRSHVRQVEKTNGNTDKLLAIINAANAALVYKHRKAGGSAWLLKNVRVVCYFVLFCCFVC